MINSLAKRSRRRANKVREWETDSIYIWDHELDLQRQTDHIHADEIPFELCLLLL